MNEWNIYTMLKDLIIPTKQDIETIKKMEAEEVKEGFNTMVLCIIRG